MKRLLFVLLGFVCCIGGIQAQPVPGKMPEKPVFIVNATLHLGNGEKIEGGVIGFSQGKINYVGTGAEIRIDGQNSIIIDAVGKQVYPGFIAPNSVLGLSEVEAVRATNDFRETGSYNPHVRALVAYNTDSKVIPTIRSNGVLLSQISPTGGLISGRSSVVQLDAWNWEDAAVAADEGLWINWPSMRVIQSRWAGSAEEQEKQTEKQLQELAQFFADARAYLALENPPQPNARFDAMRPALEGKARIYVRTNQAKAMVAAVIFFQEMQLPIVLVGAEEADLVLDFLVKNKVDVLLEQTHRLPATQGSAVDQPYALPAKLLKAGIRCGLMVDGFWQIRNLPFHAGHLAAYGLSKEEALQLITANNAAILGISDRYGSLEAGKSATLFISAGDALDMRGCQLERAFIDGREISLENTQKALYKRFSDKYEHRNP